MTTADANLAIITSREADGARAELGDPRDGKWLETSVVCDLEEWE